LPGRGMRRGMAGTERALKNKMGQIAAMPKLPPATEKPGELPQGRRAQKKQKKANRAVSARRAAAPTWPNTLCRFMVVWAAPKRKTKKKEPGAISGNGIGQRDEHSADGKIERRPWAWTICGRPNQMPLTP